MKIVLLCPKDHIFANYILKGLIKRYKDMIVGVFESKGASNKGALVSMSRAYFKKGGFYFLFWQGIRQLVFKTGVFFYGLFNFANIKSPFYHWKRLLADKRGVVYLTDDINRDKDIKKLSDLSPDLIVSIFFPHILKNRVLALAKFGCLNIHPSLLPDFKGLHPVFWALAAKSPYAGVSLHSMRPQIDAGPIIAQKKIEVLSHDTEHALYAKACVMGLDLLIGAIDRLGREGGFLHISENNPAGNYYSIPDRRAIRDFRQAKRKLFNFRELFYDFGDFLAPKAIS